VAAFLEIVLHPRGIAVVIEGQHLCAMMRGVQKKRPA
jgi:GTP cyclohydrolase I